MPIASNSAESAYDAICRAKLDTTLERTDNNNYLQTPETGGEIIPESGGAIISEQWGGFIGIGTVPNMGQFSMKISRDTGSLLSANQHRNLSHFVVADEE